MSLWAFLVIVGIALMVASAVVVYIALRWDRHEAPAYWDETEPESDAAP